MSGQVSCVSLAHTLAVMVCALADTKHEDRRDSQTLIPFQR